MTHVLPCPAPPPPLPAEAHATLAAMLWQQGRLAEAEGQLNVALEQGGRWADPAFVVNNRWPPALADALQRMVAIDDRGVGA